MTTFQELHRQGVSLLRRAERPGLESKVLLLESLGLSELEFWREPERPVPEKAAVRFRRMVGRRKAGWPLAYLVGRKEFWSMDFGVRPGVFIPRPETELLVELVRERAGRPDPSILDLGTGSGNIALALAGELPQAKILGLDISAKALAVARHNARRLRPQGPDMEEKIPSNRHRAFADALPPPIGRGIKLRPAVIGATPICNPLEQPPVASGGKPRVTFLRSSFFSGLAGRRPRPRFDVIVSNPPYVSEKEWRKFSPTRRRYEPKQALVPGPTGLEAINRIVRESPEWLKPGGWLVLEIGAGQRKAALGLFDNRWGEVRCYKDLSGLARAVAARLKTAF